MASILAPVLYLILVIGGLVVFSYFYKKRLASKQIEPWYPSHPERDLYISLLNQTDPKPNDAILKAALIRRAMTDVKRVVKLREDKPALQNLVQKGSVGDDLWNAMVAAEKELEAELLEVINEANSFVPGWGQIIFQTAGEMVQNERMREIYDEIPKVKAKQEKKYVKKTQKSSKAPSEKPAPTETPIIQTPPSQDSPEQPMTPPRSPKPHTNGLAPPISADLESVTSASDGEQASSVTSSPSKPKGTPKSGKKGKKRK